MLVADAGSSTLLPLVVYESSESFVPVRHERPPMGVSLLQQALLSPDANGFADIRGPRKLSELRVAGGLPGLRAAPVAKPVDSDTNYSGDLR